MMVEVQSNKIPAILVTDLYYHFCYHPKEGLLGGFDDYIDTAVFLKNQRFNQRGIILDNHLSPEQPQDGGRVAKRLMELSDKTVPCPIGLNYSLKSIDDSARGIKASGADLIENEIRRLGKKDRLALITVGGFTDIAIALNRLKPPRKLPVDVYFAAAFYKKQGVEYNVALDVNGFLSVVRNKAINLIWAPCDVTEMFYDAPQELGASSSPLARYLLDRLFMYRYCKYLNEGKKPNEINWRDVFSKGSWIWSKPLFSIASGKPHIPGKEPFTLEEIPVEFDDEGKFVPEDKQSKNRRAKVVTSIDKEKLSDTLTKTLCD